MSPLSGLRLDVEALSGVLGSISIACWVVVFTPQIVENFRRSSAEGLSVTFLIIWLLGDVANIIGAILQGVLPTMIILAIYYTLADIVLIVQCFYYRGQPAAAEASTAAAAKPGTQHRERSATDDGDASADADADADAAAPLLRVTDADGATATNYGATTQPLERSGSTSSWGADGTHLSPATPLLAGADGGAPPAARHFAPSSALATAVRNTLALLLVCAAGAGGWWISTRRSRAVRDAAGDPWAMATYSSGSSNATDEDDGAIHMDMLGQAFGYLCAIFYLGSRLPQLLLNFRRKSTEGVSFLFFLFACVGNLTYVLSILAYAPPCASPHRHHSGGGRPRPRCGPDDWWSEYGWYIVVNLSWLIGSAGTLFMDLAIFAQFWLYQGRTPVVVADGSAAAPAV